MYACKCCAKWLFAASSENYAKITARNEKHKTEHTCRRKEKVVIKNRNKWIKQQSR
jgi:hypothetical protein